MGLREQLAGAAKESHAILARDEKATVCGRQVTLISTGVSSLKTVADAAFFGNAATTFHVLKTELTGFTVDTLQGQLVSFGQKTLRIAAVSDNGLHFALTLEAENKGR